MDTPRLSLCEYGRPGANEKYENTYACTTGQVDDAGNALLHMCLVAALAIVNGRYGITSA